MAKYFTLLRYCFLPVFNLIVATIAFSGYMIVFPSIYKGIVDKLFFFFDNWYLNKYILILNFMLVFVFLTRFILGYSEASIRSIVILKLRQRLFSNALMYRYKFFQENDVGFLVKRLVDDTQEIGAALSKSCEGFCYLILVAIIGVVFWYFDNQIFQIYVLLVLVSTVWAFLWKIPIGITNKGIGEHYSRIYSFYWEVLPGIKEIKVSSLENWVMSKLDSIQRGLKKTMVINSFCNTMMWQISFPLPWVGYAFVMILGFSKIQNQEITIGTLLSLMAIFFVVMDPINKLLDVFGVLQSGWAASYRLRIFNSSHLEKSGKEIAKQINSVCLKQFNYSIPNGPTLFKDVDLKFEKGTSYAIMGKSGSGKTTMANLLSGLISEYRGEVLFNDISLKNFSLDSLRKKICYVTQDVFLFEDTISNNIDLFGNLNSGELQKIIDVMGLDKIVNKQGDLSNVTYGKGGIDLSGGEKQRIALARSLATKADIYIFDEVTSSLDYKLGKSIWEYIRVKLSDKIIISITHQMDIAIKSDVLLKIEDQMVKKVGFLRV